VKKKLLFIPVALLLAMSLVVIGCPAPTPPAGEEGAPPSGQIVNLKIANYFAPTAKHSLILEDFSNELEQRTNGQVQVDYYAGGSLLTAPAMFDGVIDGVADIGYSHVYYTPGRMPVTETAGLPLAYPSAWVSGEVLNDFYNEFKPKEFDDVVVLMMNTSTPSAISTAKKPIRTLEDLKGLTIRAPSLSGEVIAALGGTPAPTPMMEVYDAIAKGELDGEQSNFETLLSFKFGEVVKYVTSIWQLSFPYPFYCVMNKDSYNKLPADIKPIFDKLVGEYKERFLLVWNSIDFLGKEFGLSQGVEFIDLSDAEAARWVAAVQPVIDAQVAKMVAAGYSETEVRGWINFLKERADYWTQKQIEYHITSVAGPPEVRP
jgi:TRAP-type C4-dicarboxylate transport system substrate-binding protein